MFLKYITFFSGFIYLIFSFVLILKKVPNKKANFILGFLFLIMAIYCILLSYYYSALFQKETNQLVYYIPFDYVFVMLMGPFIFYYMKVLLNQAIANKLWLHAIAILPALIFNFYFLQLSGKERINLLIVNFEVGIWQTNLLNGFFYIQMTTYLIICFRLIRKQLKISSKVLIDSVQVDISWLNTLIIIDLIIMFASAPLSFYFANEKANIIIAQLAMDIQLIYIFIKSVWQTEIFPVENIVEQRNRDKESILKITDEKAEDYFKILMLFMESNKPHLLENCNIMTISEQTGISVHHLSNILNKRFDKNFPDFINEYRINYAKKLLISAHPEKITLEAIGYECGFGSKSSFNKAFKKHTNLTPTEYRQQNKFSDFQIELLK